VVPDAWSGTTPPVQLPVVLGGAVLDELEPGMFGQWRALAAPGAADPVEPVEPVLASVDVELVAAVVLAAGVAVPLLVLEAAWATVAPAIAPAAPRTASALIMRGRIIGCLLCVWWVSPVNGPGLKRGSRRTETPLG
jgi:hypothetical protein